MQIKSLITKKSKLKKSRPKKSKLNNRKSFVLLYINEPLNLLIKNKKKNVRKRNKTKKTLFWQLEIMLLKMKRKKVIRNTIIT